MSWLCAFPPIKTLCAGQLEDIREQNRAMASLDYVKLLDDYRTAEKAELERQEREDEEFVQ